jgi:hypothetical protein
VPRGRHRSADPAASVLLPNDELVISGQTLQLTATVVDATGSPIPGEPITFTTRDPDVLRPHDAKKKEIISFPGGPR